MLVEHWLRLAISRTFCTAGKSMPMRTPMMAITTSTSIRVNPGRSSFFLLARTMALFLSDEGGFATWAFYFLADDLGRNFQALLTLRTDHQSGLGGSAGRRRPRPGCFCCGCGRGGSPPGAQPTPSYPPAAPHPPPPP